MAMKLYSDTSIQDIANAIRTKNGSSTTYKVGEMAQAILSLPTGASNIVQGDFHTGSSAGASTLSIPYTGSGYPIACIVVVKNGAYNSASTPWYSSTQRYAVGQWTMTKSVMTSTPSYTTSGSQNQGVITSIYKNSTSSSTSYTRTSAMNTNVYTSNNASNSAVNVVKFKSRTSMSYYVNTSSYGLLPNQDYQYIIIYSQ